MPIGIHRQASTIDGGNLTGSPGIYHRRSGIPRPRVAEAIGAKGIRLEEPEDVKDALSDALAHQDGPVVVDAVVDPFALSLPSHVPFHTAKNYTLSLAKQVLSGKMDEVIKTIEHNVRLV
jgi:pyruvate dehydrogenase (quinone)